MRTIICTAAILAVSAARAGLLEDSGVKGGLVVVVGCDDPGPIVELGQDEKYLVQALDADPARVEKARDAIIASGDYGRVSATLIRGKTLPYADAVVNLLVVRDGELGLPPGEIERVLAPRGVAVAPQGAACLPPSASSIGHGRAAYTKLVDPYIDEWTHYLYDPKNNAVSHDQLVADPKRLRWVSGPEWSRHHDHMSSINAVVTSGGRIFSILDEGPRSSIQLPSDWKVVARDAYNGKLLWKRSIPEWHTEIWPAKAGPAPLPRRLVAVDDRVFVTLGLNAPVAMLDAATGETRATFEKTGHAEEILVSDGQLFVTAHAATPPEGKWKLDTVRCWTETGRANNARPWKWDKADPKRIVALDIASGEFLWTKDTPVAPITLAVDDERVLYHNGTNVVCLDRASGRQRWTSQYTIDVSPAVKAAPNLVIYEEVVLFSAGPGEVASISIEDGKTLWIDSHGPSGHQSSYDLLVADGLVWSTSHGTVRSNIEGKSERNKLAKSVPRWTFFGRDPVTGEVKRTIPPGKSDWFHHRCHRGRATDRYLMMARTGIEYVDLESGEWQPNPWVRGACLYGFMPANGLTYAPPHPCACYIESKLIGFNALAAERPGDRASRMEASSDTGRLERGPAYDAMVSSGAEAVRFGSPPTGAWPTYRSDNMRSGSGATEVPATLRPAWRTPLGGKLSAVTVAGGRVFVAEVDRHTVCALDSTDGTILWKYTAGGRVDSPPTIVEVSFPGDGGQTAAEGKRKKALCIFGCRDGWIYSVRAEDGALVWRSRAAPEDCRIVAYDQLESKWPVSGAVLVQDGAVYCVAGRSMFLDGGLHVVKLDALTGELQFDGVMGDTLPGSAQPLHATAGALDMPVALPDILSSDGRHLYMRSQSIELNGKRTDLNASGATDQGGDDAHLLCSSGYLEDSWFHRAYWVFGRGYGTGHNGWFRAGRFAPSGRILAFNEDSVFGYGRLPNMYVWSSALEYQLYSARRNVSPEDIQRVADANRKQEQEHGHGITFDRNLYGSFPLKEISAVTFGWRRERPPVLARAMALAGHTLFVAGPRDTVDEEQRFANPFDPKVLARAQEQVAAMQGQRGAVLLSVSTADGSTLSELDLESCPIFDGVAAAESRLFLSTMDGSVVCCE